MIHPPPPNNGSIRFLSATPLQRMTGAGFADIWIRYITGHVALRSILAGCD